MIRYKYKPWSGSWFPPRKGRVCPPCHELKTALGFWAPAEQPICFQTVIALILHMLLIWLTALFSGLHPQHRSVTTRTHPLICHTSALNETTREHFRGQSDCILGHERFIFWFWESPTTGWHACQVKNFFNFLICIYFYLICSTTPKRIVFPNPSFAWR